MYSPERFRERDVARLHDLIDAYPFAMLVATGAKCVVEIAHVPFLLDRGAGALGTLRFHVARANSIWRAATSSTDIVAVFRGPDAYVSASWYEKPNEQVPTWNYAVVHAHGRAAGPMTHAELRQLLVDLSARHESGSTDPWSLDRLDPAFADTLQAEIVGVAIPIERLDGKLKLSQNRSLVDQARVREALAERGSPADVEILRWMK